MNESSGGICPAFTRMKLLRWISPLVVTTMVAALAFTAPASAAPSPSSSGAVPGAPTSPRHHSSPSFIVDPGPGEAASFIHTAATNLHDPSGSVEDAAGNITFAESAANKIVLMAHASGTWFGQSMTPGGTYTIAGTGTAGYSGSAGPGASAELNDPAGIALDPNGNLVVADGGNCVVRVVADTTGTFYQVAMTAGYIYTIAGTPSTCSYGGDDGPATSAYLDDPTGISVDAEGDVFIADSLNYRVRILSGVTCESDGIMHLRSPAGTPPYSRGCGFGFTAMGTGYIYTLAGDGTAGYSGSGVTGTSAEMRPEGVSVDDMGNVIVADGANEVIRMVAAAGTTVGVGSGPPYGLSGTTAGYVYTIVGSPSSAGYSGDGASSASAELDDPDAVAVDGDGNIVIADTANNVIRLAGFSSTVPNYGLSADCGTGGSSCAWSNGDIFTIAGDHTAGYTGDGGPAVDAELDGPQSVTANLFGQILISDSANNAVRYFGGAPVVPESVDPQGTPLGADQYGGGGGSQTSCACSTHSPVNIATGDYYDTTTDLDIPGAGIPLEFTRTYDSFAAQAEAGSAAAVPPLGYGWSSNLGMSILYSSATGVPIATVTEANGALITFEYYEIAQAGEQPWCPNDATVAIFCPTAPRYSASLTESTGGIFTYVNELSSPMAYTFGGTGGTLSEIEDANGDTLTSATYVPATGQPACATGDTCLAWTSDPSGSSSGQSLVVATKTVNSHVMSVFDPAATAQTATFMYTGTGCSTWTSGLPTDLCTATDPGALATSYTYSHSSPTAGYQYDELTMSPPSSGEITNSYTSGQVTSQAVTTGTGTSQVTAFVYATGSEGATTTTVTAYPLGTGGGEPTEPTEYQFSEGVLVAATTGYGTSLAATSYFDRDPATLLATTTIDGDGNISGQSLDDYASPGGTPASSADALTVTDGVNQTSQYAYTAANLAWCSVDAAEYLDDVRCPGTEPTAPPGPGVTDPDLGVSLSFYNSADELTATTDPLGNTTLFEYTSAVFGILNGMMYCSVDPVDYQKSIACPAYAATHVSGTATSTFDATGDVTSSTDADGDETTYAYGVSGLPGLVSSEIDPDGSKTSFTYNNLGEVTQQVVSAPSPSTYSATTLNAYNAAGQNYCTVAPFEAASPNDVTCHSLPITTPTPLLDEYLGATITNYDSDGRVIQTTNPVGGITLTAYDQAGEVYCTVGPFEAASPNNVTCPADTFALPTTSSDTYPGTTLTNYDSDGRPVQVTNPLGGITLSTYDPAGNLATTTVESASSTSSSDPNLDTSYNYDGDNRVISTSVGSGSDIATSGAAYDPNGNAYCSISADAETGTYQCPPWEAGWISAPPNPVGLYPSLASNVTTTFYNDDGEQLQTTNPDVETTVSAYDGDGRTTCTSDPVNADPWLTANTTATSPYNCPSAPLTTPPAVGSDPGYVTTIYDYAGRTSSVTDQIGDTTGHTYDAAGNPLSTVNAEGDTTTDCYYGQDSGSECASAAPVSGGSADQLYSQLTPDTAADPTGEKTYYSYFPGGLLDTTATPAGTATENYDGLGDVATESYSAAAAGYAAAPNVSYAYFPDGSRYTMTDGTGTTTYAYDAMGDMTSQQFVAPSASSLTSITMGYTYFATGALASVVYPTYGTHALPSAGYTYDSEGNMASVADWLAEKVNFVSDGDGNLTSQDNLVSGTQTSGTTFGYDAADQNISAVSSQPCSSTALTQSFSGSTGSRNADGQVTQDEETYGSGCSGGSYERNYGYDIAGRIDYQGSVARGSSPYNLAFDPTAGSNANDESDGPTEISSHDSSGNFDTYDQAYDAAGEVTSQTPVSGSSGAASTYSYDTIGDLATSASGSSTTTDSYDQSGQLLGVGPAPPAVTGYQYTGDGMEAASLGWSATDDIDTSNDLTSVSCPTTTFCEAVDGSSNTFAYNGSSWTKLKIIGSGVLEAVSCASASFCVAVNNAGDSYVYSGTWGTTPSNFDGTRTLASVSCPAASFCAAVDSAGNAWTTTNGTTWSEQTPDTTNLKSISCASATSCVAVDRVGYAFSYSSGTWGTGQHIDGSNTFHSVSCPTTSFCAAVDGAGNVLTYSGTTWSPAHAIDGTLAIEAVSCTSPTFCQAVDAAGNELTFDGASWSPAENIDSTRTLNSVSCTSSSYCIAVDASGNELTMSAASMTWDRASGLPLVASDGTNDYIYGPGAEPVEQVNITSSPPSDNPVFLTYEPSDSSWLVTSTAGTQLSFYRYDAFGNLALGTPASPFGYAGQYSGTSPNPGLDNMRARWYDPQTGGLTTRDPDFSATDQAYAYAGGDPVDGSDPTGLGKWWNPCNWGNACHHVNDVVKGGLTWTSRATGWNLCLGFVTWVAECGQGSYEAVCTKAIPGSNGPAEAAITAYFNDTVGLPGFFDGPISLVTQTLAIASAGAVALIYQKEGLSDITIDQFTELIPALPPWQLWSSDVRTTIVTNGLTLYAVETELNDHLTGLLPFLPAQALGILLGGVEPNSNPYGG
jgi:RHS repeat-associated protein